MCRKDECSLHGAGMMTREWLSLGVRPIGAADSTEVAWAFGEARAPANHGLSLSTGMVEAEVVSSILGSDRRRWRGPEETTSWESNQANRSQGGPDARTPLQLR